MKQTISLDGLRHVLRQLGKTHPASHLNAEVMEAYREWVREQGPGKPQEAGSLDSEKGSNPSSKAQGHPH